MEPIMLGMIAALYLSLLSPLTSRVRLLPILISVRVRRIIKLWKLPTFTNPMSLAFSLKH